MDKKELLAFCFLLGLVLQANCRSVGNFRDEDADGDYEEELEEISKKNQVGVLDIIGGAFSGDLNKVLKGSFSFTDKEVGESLIPKITGVKPKKKPVKASVNSAPTKDKEEDEEPEN